MAKRVLIIDGHPDRENTHLCGALAEAYSKGCENGGHEVRHIRVSEMDFSLLRTKEEFESGELSADIKHAQEENMRRRICGGAITSSSCIRSGWVRCLRC